MSDHALRIVLGLSCLACTPADRSAGGDGSTPASSEPTPAPAVSEPTIAEPPAPVDPAAPAEPQEDADPPPMPTVPADPNPLHERQRLSVADGSIASWCEVEAWIEWPIDRGSYAQTVAALLDKVVTRDELCVNGWLHQTTCDSDGPWFVIHDYEISLIVPLGADQFGRIPELAPWSNGTEEYALVVDSRLDSSEAWIKTSAAEQICGDDEDLGELCAYVSTEELEIVISDLHDGSFLVTRVSIDPRPEVEPRELLFLKAVDVEILGNTAKIEACNGRTQVELPSRMNTRTDNPVADEAGPPISVSDAKAAAERCNEGWKKFGVGDLAGAKRDIDAALELLERAIDDRGHRSLGACLYNRGRIAEEEDDDSYAIELYQESLAARQNDVVQRRLDQLLK